MISRVEFERKKQGLRYDRGKWVGYRVDVRSNGKRYRPVFGTKYEAEKFVSELKVKVTFNRAGLSIQTHGPTVRELLSERLKRLKNNHPEYVRGKRIFDQFLNSLDSEVRVRNLTKAHFQAYINERSKTVGDTTITREFAMVRAAFNTADEIFPELADWQPPRITRKTKRRRRATRHVITKEEMEGVAEYLHCRNFHQIANMWTIAWYLGLRYSEVLKLKKSNYKKGQLRDVKRFKTDELTDFEYLPPELCKVIEDAIQRSSTEDLFPHSITYPNRFYRVLKPAVESVGLEYGRKETHQVSFHSLRHSFVTRAMEQGDLATTASLSSHSDGTMVAHYSHSSAKKRVELLQKMYGVRDLESIYDLVRKGEMSLEEFIKSVG